LPPRAKIEREVVRARGDPGERFAVRKQESNCSSAFTVSMKTKFPENLAVI